MTIKIMGFLAARVVVLMVLFKKSIVHKWRFAQ